MLSAMKSTVHGDHFDCLNDEIFFENFQMSTVKSQFIQNLNSFFDIQRTISIDAVGTFQAHCIQIVQKYYHFI